jgi:hypothetical protein
MHPTDRRVKAAFRATIATGIGALLFLVPVVNVILFIGLMLPLWTVSNLGIPGLGHELNGFFVPSPTGWSIVAVVAWGTFFMLFSAALKRRH